MIERHDLYFLWTEEPLHAGSGSSVGVTDRPIQRERHTQHPHIQYSGVKGAIKDHCRASWTKPELNAVFGADRASDSAGCLSFSEMRLLLFPVCSLRGVFAWVTCPLALSYLARNLGNINALPKDAPLIFADQPGEGTVWVTPDSPLVFDQGVVLEQNRFNQDSKGGGRVLPIARWLCKYAMPQTEGYTYFRSRLHQDGVSHLAILSDTQYTQFVQQGVNVTTRNRIDDDSGVVEDTALWTEETLPTDCLLYSVVHISAPRSRSVPDSLADEQGDRLIPSARKAQTKLLQTFGDRAIVQMGGNTTVGCGRTRILPLNQGGQ